MTSTSSVTNQSLLFKHGFNVVEHVCTLLPVQDLATMNRLCKATNTQRIWIAEANRNRRKALAFLNSTPSFEFFERSATGEITRRVIDNGQLIKDMHPKQICEIGRRARLLEKFPGGFLERFLSPSLAADGVDRYFALPRIDSDRISVHTFPPEILAHMEDEDRIGVRKIIGEKSWKASRKAVLRCRVKQELLPQHCVDRKGSYRSMMRRETENGPTIVLTTKSQTDDGVEFLVHELFRMNTHTQTDQIPEDAFIPAKMETTFSQFCTRGVEIRKNTGERRFELSRPQNSRFASFSRVLENSFIVILSYPFAQIHPYEPVEPIQQASALQDKADRKQEVSSNP